MLEMRQKLLLLKHHKSGVFRCFERKLELQEMVPLGGHPHTPRQGGGELLLSGCQFLNGPILEKGHTIARYAKKSYVTETKMEL